MSGGLNKAKNEEKRGGEFEGTPRHNFINQMNDYAAYFGEHDIDTNKIIDECIKAEGKAVLTESDSKLNELKTLLKEYLAFSSMDGNNKRIELRKQLNKFVD